MKIENLSIRNQDNFGSLPVDIDPQLILMFCCRQWPYTDLLLDHIKSLYPKADIIGCSSAGEISDIEVHEFTAAITLIELESSTYVKHLEEIFTSDQSEIVGQRLIESLPAEGLRHVLVFANGHNVDGSALVKGMMARVPLHVSITGGMAGDGIRFGQTFVIDNEVKEDAVVAIGLYGEKLRVGYGSQGGWDSFGIEREVTRSEGNVVYEIDHQPALDLYKSYLGPMASNLPLSGLLFPLSVRDGKYTLPVVRTLLSIDESERSITFAGSIPTGSYVRFMKANVDRIINGAARSAGSAFLPNTELTILVSCIGRRLVLKQLVEEEIEAVREVIGDNASITGFYSYGEIAPFENLAPCQLHNQTMTITTLSES